MKTDQLIVELARGAAPVRVLARPSLRLARWMAAMLPLAAAAVFVIRPRVDVGSMVTQPAFVGIAVATLATALVAAACALMLSVPGAERYALQRVVPLLTGGLWVLALVVLLNDGGGAAQRLSQFPFHVLCVTEIAAIGAVPGWVLFVMLRRAAPLRRAWSGAFATLAAVSLGAVATQFLCPIDDPAHQLVGHALPVAALSMLGAVAGHRWLDWVRTAAQQGRTAAR